MKQFITVRKTDALAYKLGIPAASCWATVPTGYCATVWAAETETHCARPDYRKEGFKTYAEALRWARRIAPKAEVR